MMKELEKKLMQWMLDGKSPDEFVPPVRVRPGQIYAILERWGDKGWIEYSVNAYWSWTTDEGDAVFTALLQKEENQ